MRMDSLTLSEYGKIFFNTCLLGKLSFVNRDLYVLIKKADEGWFACSHLARISCHLNFLIMSNPEKLNILNIK